MAFDRNTAASYILARAPRFGLDPRAALAVAASEGLSGGVGDSGTSFGPFQLHIGGASPYSDPGQARAFAESPAGIDYALRAEASAGAAGLTGRPAIEAIVRNFERPADPDSEIARALGYYGGGQRLLTGRPNEPTGGGAPPFPFTPTPSPSPSPSPPPPRLAPQPTRSPSVDPRLALALAGAIGQLAPGLSPLASLLARRLGTT